MRHKTRLATALVTIVFGVLAASCGGSSGTAADKTPAPLPTISASAAEARLKQIALQSADVGAGYVIDQTHLQTNEDAAKARPDTENARRQYDDWGQVLQYNVQFAAPPDADLVFNGKTARVMNTATLYQTADGASAAYAYIRDLPSTVVANFLVNDSAGTKITDTQVVKDLAFPARGDATFAWRISGKATFDNGFVVNFIADAVFVRVGRVTGNVTAVALGQPPTRDEVVRLVDAFVAKAGAGGP